jgi:hypothetical protein
MDTPYEQDTAIVFDEQSHSDFGIGKVDPITSRAYRTLAPKPFSLLKKIPTTQAKTYLALIH